MDAHAAQQRLRQWQQAGVGLTQAARLTGLARSTLQAIRNTSSVLNLIAWAAVWRIRREREHG